MDLIDNWMSTVRVGVFDRWFESASSINGSLSLLHGDRNLSGVYTNDFPDQPLSYYNFTGEDLPINTTVSTQGTKVKMLNYNETVEIIFQGINVLDSSETHPMHFHGYNFYVVGSGYGNFNPEIDPDKYNLVDPLHVNTIAVPKNGWVTIRFIANNPGVWYWHCHFDRHLTWGMATVFIVKNGNTPETSMRDPPPNLPQCESQFTNQLQQLDIWEKYVPNQI